MSLSQNFIYFLSINVNGSNSRADLNQTIYFFIFHVKSECVFFFYLFILYRLTISRILCESQIVFLFTCYMYIRTSYR